MQCENGCYSEIYNYTLMSVSYPHTLWRVFKYQIRRIVCKPENNEGVPLIMLAHPLAIIFLPDSRVVGSDII